MKATHDQIVAAGFVRKTGTNMLYLHPELPGLLFRRMGINETPRQHTGRALISGSGVLIKSGSFSSVTTVSVNHLEEGSGSEPVVFNWVRDVFKPNALGDQNGMIGSETFSLLRSGRLVNFDTSSELEVVSGFGDILGFIPLSGLVMPTSPSTYNSTVATWSRKPFLFVRTYSDGMFPEMVDGSLVEAARIMPKEARNDFLKFAREYATLVGTANQKVASVMSAYFLNGEWVQDAFTQVEVNARPFYRVNTVNTNNHPPPRGSVTVNVDLLRREGANGVLLFPWNGHKTVETVPDWMTNSLAPLLRGFDRAPVFTGSNFVSSTTVPTESPGKVDVDGGGQRHGQCSNLLIATVSNAIVYAANKLTDESKPLPYKVLL